MSGDSCFWKTAQQHLLKWRAVSKFQPRNSTPENFAIKIKDQYLKTEPTDGKTEAKTKPTS